MVYPTLRGMHSCMTFTQQYLSPNPSLYSIEKECPLIVLKAFPESNDRIAHTLVLFFQIMLQHHRICSSLNRTLSMPDPFEAHYEVMDFNFKWECHTSPHPVLLVRCDL